MKRINRFCSTIWTFNAAGWLVLALASQRSEAFVVFLGCAFLAYRYSTMRST